MVLLAGEAFGQKPRELPHWQVVAIGALAGSLASIATTPADVVKTRIMTASATQAVSSGALSVPAPVMAHVATAVTLSGMLLVTIIFYEGVVPVQAVSYERGFSSRQECHTVLLAPQARS